MQKNNPKRYSKEPCTDCGCKISRRSLRCRKCNDAYISGSNNNRFRKVEKICLNCKNQFIVHQFKIKENRGKFCSQSCYWADMSKRKGNQTPRWKGGITSENELIRKSIEYRLWREAVFARDNFTCQECNIIGGKLQAHHIKPFSLFPELRLAIDNGITLCKSCHLLTDTYGSKVHNYHESNT